MIQFFIFFRQINLFHIKKVNLMEVSFLKGGDTFLGRDFFGAFYYEFDDNMQYPK